MGAAVEFASAGLWAVTAPLFEEESDALVLALITQRAYPVDVDPAMAGSGFAAGDQPVDVCEVESFQRAK